MASYRDIHYTRRSLVEVVGSVIGERLAQHRPAFAMGRVRPEWMVADHLVDDELVAERVMTRFGSVSERRKGGVEA